MLKFINHIIEYKQCNPYTDERVFIEFKTKFKFDIKRNEFYAILDSDSQLGLFSNKA